MKFSFLSLIVFVVGLISCTPKENATVSLIHEKEIRFSDVRQLTFTGENAEAYLSDDDKWLIFQSANDSTPCDQIFIMDVEGKNRTKISNGFGKTTCAYFIPGTDQVIYASTQGADKNCPPPADYSKGYVWPIYDSHDLYISNRDGSNLKQITTTPGYDAEATVSPDGSTIVFTSMRDGDLDIYTMKVDGSNVKRLTTELGYDGGAFFSPDGKKIVYRSYHPKTDEEITSYKDLLAEGVIRPANFELWVMNADGSDKRQITKNGAANFAPFFTPDGSQIIFSSNVGDQTGKGREFDLFMVNADGSGETEQVTYSPQFDGFPMFTKDGKYLVFASNRNNGGTRSTNIFIAQWNWNK